MIRVYNLSMILLRAMTGGLYVLSNPVKGKFMPHHSNVTAALLFKSFHMWLVDYYTYGLHLGSCGTLWGGFIENPLLWHVCRTVYKFLNVYGKHSLPDEFFKFHMRFWSWIIVSP